MGSTTRCTCCWSEATDSIETSEKETKNKRAGQGSAVSRRQLGSGIISGMVKESWIGGRELIHEWVNKKRQARGGWGSERHKGWVRNNGNSEGRDVRGQERTWNSVQGSWILLFLCSREDFWNPVSNSCVISALYQYRQRRCIQALLAEEQGRSIRGKRVPGFQKCSVYCFRCGFGVMCMPYALDLIDLEVCFSFFQRLILNLTQL